MDDFETQARLHATELLLEVTIGQLLAPMTPQDREALIKGVTAAINARLDIERSQNGLPEDLSDMTMKHIVGKLRSAATLAGKVSE